MQVVGSCVNCGAIGQDKGEGGDGRVMRKVYE